MKHIRTVTSRNTQEREVNYATSCKTSVTLGSNFNQEKSQVKK